jgi:CubicO group peptidase (beta-lactamase class C family)
MYNPDSVFRDIIVPTEYDSTYRGRLLVGEVHDENAWVMGGIAPHAGLFSTARDIAIYGQMMSNRGEWMGRRYFNDYDIEMFTERQNVPEGSDRAIGWDTPSQNGKSSAGDYFSISSFGHLGFTGTSFWVDPERDVVVVLLTNRVHPTRNKKGIYGIRRAFHTEVMKEILNHSDKIGLE